MSLIVQLEKIALLERNSETFQSAISIKLGRQRGFYSWTKIGAQRPASAAALLVLTISCIVGEVFVLAVRFPSNPVRN